MTPEELNHARSEAVLILLAEGRDAGRPYMSVRRLVIALRQRWGPVLGDTTHAQVYRSLVRREGHMVERTTGTRTNASYWKIRNTGYAFVKDFVVDNPHVRRMLEEGIYV